MQSLGHPWAEHQANVFCWSKTSDVWHTAPALQIAPAGRSPAPVCCLQINTNSVQVNRLSSPVPVVTVGWIHQCGDVASVLSCVLSCCCYTHESCALALPLCCPVLRELWATPLGWALPAAEWVSHSSPPGSMLARPAFLALCQQGEQWGTGCLDRSKGTVSTGNSWLLKAMLLLLISAGLIFLTSGLRFPHLLLGTCWLTLAVGRWGI